MITRRGVLLTSGIGLAIGPSLSRAQPADALRRVAWFSIGSRTNPHNGYLAFTQGMLDLGWKEGKNVEYRRVYANGEVSRLDALASELVRQNVDVIVVGNATTACAFQRATKTIPIVMGSVNDPVGNGLVGSLAKPGGNITGIATQSDEVLSTLVGILHEVTPGAKRIAFLLNEASPSYSGYWFAAQSACTALELSAQRIVASAPAQLGRRRRRDRATAIAGRRGRLRPLVPQRARPSASADAGHPAARGLFLS